MRRFLRDGVLARTAGRYERVEVGYPALEAWRGAGIDEYPLAYASTHAVYIPVLGKKFIAYDHFPVVVGEMAREYLRVVWDGYPRGGALKKADGWRWNAPLFCEPVRHRALAYVDVTSAFWQLVSPFRPDDVPLPGGEVIEGEMDWLSPEVIDGDRRLRHAVVGSLFYSELPIYRYGKACEIRVRNYWTSPALRRLTMSSLHAMAQGVRRKFGLHAWLTDAAVVDARVADDVVDWLAVHWGIRSRVVESGIGDVWNKETYRVGAKKTRNLVNGTVTMRTAPVRGFSNLRRVPGENWRQMRRERVDGRPEDREHAFSQ